MESADRIEITFKSGETISYGMIIDYITGVIVAIVRRQLSSEVGFKGIAKKVMILALVEVGHILDQHVLGGGAVCRSAVIGFYIANEGISILENAGNG